MEKFCWNRKFEQIAGIFKYYDGEGKEREDENGWYSAERSKFDQWYEFKQLHGRSQAQKIQGKEFYQALLIEKKFY
jgi:hypothetical protein